MLLYGYTSNVFIFSLRNKEELHPFKGMLTESTYAIYQQSGPTFGDGWDIYIADNANSNNESYPQPKNYKLYKLKTTTLNQTPWPSSKMASTCLEDTLILLGVNRLSLNFEFIIPRKAKVRK